MVQRNKFAVIDCEDAPKWAGHESIWVAAYGRPGEHWCARAAPWVAHTDRGFAALMAHPRRACATRYAHREHFRAFLGELPEESELDTYQGFCVTGR